MQADGPGRRHQTCDIGIGPGRSRSR